MCERVGAWGGGGGGGRREGRGINFRVLEFLCLYSVHLNRTFRILGFYHIPNISEISLIGYVELEHDNIIPDHLQNSTDGVYGSSTDFLAPVSRDFFISNA